MAELRDNPTFKWFNLTKGLGIMGGRRRMSDLGLSKDGCKESKDGLGSFSVYKCVCAPERIAQWSTKADAAQVLVSSVRKSFLLVLGNFQ